MSGKQTTTASSEPWKEAQPALKTGIATATNLLNSGVGSKVYTGSTVTPYSTQTMAGMGAIENAARGNMGGRGLSGQYQGIINSGGYNSAQQNALGNIRQVANSNFNINADPGFQQVVRSTQDAVNANASAAGRYGSGTHQGVLAREIGDLGARQYQAFQNRRDMANQNLFGMGQQGVNNLGAAYQGMNAPVQDLMKVGSMNEDLARRVMNDKLRIFDSANNAPWEQLARFNAIASGAGQLGGTQTSTQPGQNPFLTGLGALSSGAGLLGSFF